MSRRTKLLITALFLVLLGIPAAYVILTWTTPNPLRFRMVDYEAPSGEGQFANSGKLNMIVENTSSVPVHLAYADLRQPDPLLVSRRPYWSVCMPNNPPRKVIPPHTSLPCFSPTPGSVDSAFAFEDIELHYTWMSVAQYKVREAHRWLYRQVPAFVAPYIPKNWPSYEDDTTPLQPALPGQNQSQGNGR